MNTYKMAGDGVKQTPFCVLKRKRNIQYNPALRSYSVEPWGSVGHKLKISAFGHTL